MSRALLDNTVHSVSSDREELFNLTVMALPQCHFLNYMSCWHACKGHWLLESLKIDLNLTSGFFLLVLQFSSLTKKMTLS